MSEIRFSAAAPSDLLDIVVFIARDNLRVGQDWVDAKDGVLVALGVPVAARFDLGHALPRPL